MLLKRLAAGVFLIVLTCRPLSLHAQTKDWINTTHSNVWFDQGLNWSPVGPPLLSSLARVYAGSNVDQHRNLQGTAIPNGTVLGL